MTDAGLMVFWNDPVWRLTLEKNRRLILLVCGLLCTEFSQVNALRKGAADRSAWMAVEILKTLDDPDIKLKATAIKNVPAWEQDLEIPAACMQVIKILTSHHGAAHARRRIVIFLEPGELTCERGQLRTRARPTLRLQCPPSSNLEITPTCTCEPPPTDVSRR